MARRIAPLAASAALLLVSLGGDRLTAQTSDGAAPRTPREAIFAAADAADAATPAQRSVRGAFELGVRATGRQDGRLYANSELDYRDQRNLTIAIEPAAEAGLRERLGGDPATTLIGRRLRVIGAAQRVRITVLCHTDPTDKYYYQTHVRVFRPEQVVLLPDSAAAPAPRAP